MKRSPNMITDKQLLDLLQSGSRVAFSKLFSKYVDHLFNYGFQLTDDQELIKDVIQELFIDLWNNRVGLKEVKYLKTYLFSAFRYKLLRALKKPKIMHVFSQQHEETKPSPETEWILDETQGSRLLRLNEGMEQLPERQREVLHLKYYQNLPTHQIAQLLNINPQSVSNLIFRAMTNLRKLMSKKVRYK